MYKTIDDSTYPDEVRVDWSGRYDGAFDCELRRRGGKHRGQIHKLKLRAGRHPWLFLCERCFSRYEEDGYGALLGTLFVIGYEQGDREAREEIRDALGVE